MLLVSRLTFQCERHQYLHGDIQLAGGNRHRCDIHAGSAAAPVGLQRLVVAVGFADDNRVTHACAHGAGQLLRAFAGVRDRVQTRLLFEFDRVVDAEVEVVDRVSASIDRRADHGFDHRHITHGDAKDVADAIGALTRFAGLRVELFLRIDVDRRRANVFLSDAQIDERVDYGLNRSGGLRIGVCQFGFDHLNTQLNVGDVRRAGRNTDARDGDGVGGELRLVDNRRHGRYLLSQRGQRCEQTCNGEYGNRHDGEWTNDGFGTHNLQIGRASWRDR